MFRYTLFIAFFGLFISCSSNDESPDPQEEVIIPQKLIQKFKTADQSVGDSLFYENNRLVLRKEYVDDFLDYYHHYEYNGNNQLISIAKIHSTSTIPIERSAYTYNTNGTLKTRTYEGYNTINTNLYSYTSNIIYINEGQSSEVRLHLDNQGRISSADQLNSNTGEYHTFIRYHYDASNNIIKIEDQSILSLPIREFHFTYDNKKNPFLIFDQQLPNGLSIKKIEAVTSHSNYPTIHPGGTDNYTIYLNNNNFITYAMDSNTRFEYGFTYDDDDYPITIGFNSPNFDDLLIEYLP